MIFRMYPPEYGDTSIKELNKLLSEGWIVKLVTSINKDKETFNDYIL